MLFLQYMQINALTIATAAAYVSMSYNDAVGRCWSNCYQ